MGVLGSRVMKAGRVHLLLVLATTLPWGIVAGQELALPVAHQVPILEKIISYDRNFHERCSAEVVIGVVYQSRYSVSAQVKDEILKSLKGASAEPTLADNGRVVHEHVATTSITGDKAIALLIVELLDGACFLLAHLCCSPLPR